MDKLPEKFLREVRKPISALEPGQKEYVSLKDWDNGMSDRYLASVNYEEVKLILQEFGVDLKNVKVLEIGSGNAVFLDYLQEHGVNAVGVDARPRGEKKSPQVIARIEQLPFENEQFDVILSRTVFDDRFYDQDHHLMMQEIARVLKHGGMYIGHIENRRIKAPPIEGLSLVHSAVNEDLLQHYGLVYRKS